jgi:hypothetical protein
MKQTSPKRQQSDYTNKYICPSTEDSEVIFVFEPDNVGLKVNYILLIPALDGSAWLA